jgi:hypothetical protein
MYTELPWLHKWVLARNYFHIELHNSVPWHMYCTNTEKQKKYYVELNSVRPDVYYSVD